MHLTWKKNTSKNFVKCQNWMDENQSEHRTDCFLFPSSIHRTHTSILNIKGTTGWQHLSGALIILEALL
jgi:hypothetical protein